MSIAKVEDLDDFGLDNADLLACNVDFHYDEYDDVLLLPRELHQHAGRFQFISLGYKNNRSFDLSKMAK